MVKQGTTEAADGDRTKGADPQPKRILKMADKYG